MFHWQNAIELDLRDETDSGTTVTITNNGIQLYNAVNGVSTLIHHADWDT